MVDEPKQNDTDVAADPLVACEKQRDEYLAGWRRAQADFVNYKKEETKRLSEMSVAMQARAVSELLPVLDSIGFALQSTAEDNAVYKGLVMIQSQFLETLKQWGVEKIKVSRGDAFDPHIHEAMMEVEIPPDDPERKKMEGRIVEELVPGYVIEGRVVRAAKVKLAK